MTNYPLSSQINDLHIFALGLCDSTTSLKRESKSNTKSHAEAYLLFSFFMADRFDLYFSDKFDVSLLINDFEKMRTDYLTSLKINISSSSQIIELINRRKELYNNIDAKKQVSIVDIMGASVKYLTITPKAEHRNPEYEKVKDNPLYQLITKTVKGWYHTIRGIDKDEYVNNYDYEKWIHYSSKSFSELAYLIYENPLSQNITASQDYEFIYSKFGIALSNSLHGIDVFCEQIKTYL